MNSPTTPSSFPIPKLNDDFKDFEMEPSDAALDVRKWMNIGYRLYGNMLDNSEYSFFLSIPQLISQLSFLMSVCQEKTTGLKSEFGWSPTSGELAHQVQHNSLMENTESFMKVWKKEMMEASKPGQIRSTRRALCYPTCAVSFHLNTLECLRRYLVELKLFEGAKEHRNWIGQTLEGNFEKQTVVKVWDEEVLINHSTEIETNSTSEYDKKSPILMWISRANVAILPEIFDVKFLYSFKNVDYFRVVATPTLSIRERQSEMPWNMIILPCVNSNICFVLIYNFSRNLCPYEDLRVHINEHRPFAPCVVRECRKKRNVGGEDELLQNIENYEKTKKNIYFPYWNETDFHPNRFAEELQKTVDIKESFTKGGFGDLASTRAKPSPGGGDKIGHLQHFSTLNFFNAPSTRISKNNNNIDNHDQSSKMKLDESSPDNEVVPYPFCAILWDTHRHVPVYMGKITGNNMNTNGEPVKKSLWNFLFGWMKVKS